MAEGNAASAPEGRSEAGFEVQLGSFSGPLDLLCHLAESREMDAVKLNLTELVTQYIDFLVRAKGATLNELADKCWKGELLCGECKICLPERINVFLEEHQDRREKAKDIVGDMTYDGFEW